MRKRHRRAWPFARSLTSLPNDLESVMVRRGQRNTAKNFGNQALPPGDASLREPEARGGPPDLLPHALGRDQQALFAQLRAACVTMASVADLKPHPRHARQHADAKIGALARAIRRSKSMPPLIVGNGGILDGHARLKVAKHLGIAEVPVIYVRHLSPAEERVFAMGLGRFPEIVTWDLDLLRVELPVIVTELPDLALEEIGFSTIEFDRILLAPPSTDKSEAEQDHADDIPPISNNPPTTRAGDRWICGTHIILCGSALDPVAYESLLNGLAVRQVLSDPPYNQRLNGNVTTRKGRFAEFRQASGEMSVSEFTKFLQRAFELAASVCVDGAITYWFMDWRHLPEAFQAGKNVFGDLKNLVVWSKNSPGLGTFYRSQHELVLVYKVGTAKHVNNFELGQHGRTRSNLWQYPGMAGFGPGRDEALAMHVTPKPVSLLHDAILDCSNPGDIILDPFGGSGSTMIAAQRAHRRARLIEIEPSFVDTTVKRFQKATGIVAILAGDGRTFDEVAAARAAETLNAPEARDAE